MLHFIRYKDLVNWSVAHLLDNQFNYNKKYELVKIGDFLKRNKTIVMVKDEIEYKRVTIKLNNGGVFLRDKKLGSEIGTKKQYLIKEGQFLLSKIDARNGAFGIATKEVDGAIITADFFAYDVDKSKIEPYFLVLLTTTKQFKKFAQSASSGTTGRQRINEKEFLNIKIPLPPLQKQKEIVKNYKEKIFLAKQQEKQIKNLEKEIEDYLYNELGIVENKKEDNPLLKFVNFKDLESWSVQDLLNITKISFKYQSVKLRNIACIIMGNSPSSEKINNKKVGFKFIGGASDIKDKKIISQRYINSNSKLSKKGDILFCVRATIGNPFFLDDIYFLGRGVAVIRLINNKQVNEIYLLYMLELFEKYIQLNAKGSTFKQISKPDLENFQIPLPPLDIQKNIANHILKLKKQINTLKQQAKENKALALKEFEKEIFEDE